jgi:hypothetical protein
MPKSGRYQRFNSVGIVFSYTVNVMWKEILYIIQTKPFTKEFINWCLSYTLSQPIDIDVSIILILLLQYFGLSQFGRLSEKVKALVQYYFGFNAEKKTYNMELNS